MRQQASLHATDRRRGRAYICWTNGRTGLNSIAREYVDGTGVNANLITGAKRTVSAVSLVPEPATGLLVTGGVLGLAVSRRRAGASA